MKRPVLLLSALVVLPISCSRAESRAEETETPVLSTVIMDPLAAPLSCPCVEGYAQRNYEALAKHLQHELGCKVTLTFAESLEKAVEGVSDQTVHLVIGKDSVVRSDAKARRLGIVPVASLTSKDGLTTQKGLFVVGAQDPAQDAGDLAGYRIFFGPEDSLEKHGAARELLRELRVEVAKKNEISNVCSDGASRVVERGPDARVAAVISSYAKPLLEGCGTIEKGALRVVGETREVPFVTAFVIQELTPLKRQQITEALLTVATKPDVCEALESLLGFVPYAAESTKAIAKKN